MNNQYIEETTFEKEDFTGKILPKGEYENCSFISCDFSGSDLTKIKFSECLFSGCNMSLVKLSGASFSNVKFRDCKMLGLRLEECNSFDLSFSVENCNLSHSSFYKLKQKKSVFKNSQMHEVDFTECDLSGAVFENCDLYRATFENTIIEKTDFRSSVNYSIDPEINRIKKAKFSISGIAGLLNKYDIDIEG